MIAQLAWRNLWRHPARTLITLIAITFTNALLIFMLCFQIGSYDTMKVQNLKVLDGYAQIQQADFQLQPSLHHSFSFTSNMQRLIEKIEKSAKLHFDYGLRTETFSIISNLTDSAHNASMIMGVEPKSELKISTLPHQIIQGRYLLDNDQNAIVIGNKLAEKLSVEVGDQVQILGSDLQGSLAIDLFQIVGIFSMNMDAIDGQIVQMPLAQFQQFYAMQQRVQKIIFVTLSIQEIEPLNQQLFAKLDDVSRENIRWLNWQEIQPQLAQAIQLDLNSSIFFYGFLVVIVLLILGNTLYMSMVERHNEFTLLNALGMSLQNIKKLVSAELIFMTFLGVILGVILGFLITLYFIVNGIQIPGTEALFSEYGLSGIIYPVITLQTLLSVPLSFLIAMLLLVILLRKKVAKTSPISHRKT